MYAICVLHDDCVCLGFTHLFRPISCYRLCVYNILPILVFKCPFLAVSLVLHIVFHFTFMWFVDMSVGVSR